MLNAKLINDVKIDDTENDQNHWNEEQRHHVFEISKNIHNYKCEICGLKLASEKLLQMHKVVVHHHQ